MASSARLLPLTLLLLVMLVYGNQADVSVKSWISRTVCKDLQSNCNQIKSHCESQPVVQKQCPETCGLCPEICKDLQSNCNQIKSHCESQPLVQKQCPETCGLCPEICKDLQSNCNQIKSHCESQPVVQKQCPETCGLCPEITTAAPRATTAIPDSGSNSENCGDSSSKCASLAAKGKCRKGKVFAKCRSSCPCGISSHPTCEDTESKCAKWATQGKCSKAGVYKKCRSACRCDPKTSTTLALTTEPITTTTTTKGHETTTPPPLTTPKITTGPMKTTTKALTTGPITTTTTTTIKGLETTTLPPATSLTTTTGPIKTTTKGLTTGPITTTTKGLTTGPISTTTKGLETTTSTATPSPTTPTKTVTKPTTTRPSGWQPPICGSNGRNVGEDDFLEDNDTDIEFIAGLPFSDEEIRNALLNYSIHEKPFTATYPAVFPKKIPSARGVFNTNWPNAEIPYDIDQSFSDDMRQTIITAIQEIVTKTCIRIIPREEHHTFWLRIQSTWQSRCTAKCKGIPYWNPPPCIILLGDCSRDGVVHELLHIAGLSHEHQRKDRDQFVTINWDNIEDSDNTKRQFCKLNTEDTGHTYDYESLLHYGEYAGAKEKGLKTIDSHGHPNIGKTRTMSQGDVDQINYKYCNLSQVCETGWKSIDSSNKTYCFNRITYTMNYWNAQAFCQRFGRGAQLAILDTEDKRNDIAQYMTKSAHAWVGAYVIDGAFTWLNGIPITEGWVNGTIPEPAEGLCAYMSQVPTQIYTKPCKEIGPVYPICEI